MKTHYFTKQVILAAFAHVSSVPELETAVRGRAGTLAHAVIGDPGYSPEFVRMLADNGVSFWNTLFEAFMYRL